MTGDFCLFSFIIVLSNSKALGFCTSSSVVRISVCLTSLTLCTFNSWQKWFLHLAKILLESVTKSLFSSRTILVLGWYPYLKLLIPLYKYLFFFFLLLVSSSSILALRYSFFLFLNCLLAWSPTYIFFNYVHCCVMDLVTTVIQPASFLLKFVNILQQTMFCTASIRTDLDTRYLRFSYSL